MGSFQFFHREMNGKFEDLAPRSYAIAAVSALAARYTLIRTSGRHLGLHNVGAVATFVVVANTIFYYKGVRNSLPVRPIREIDVTSAVRSKVSEWKDERLRDVQETWNRIITHGVTVPSLADREHYPEPLRRVNYQPKPPKHSPEEKAAREAQAAQEAEQAAAEKAEKKAVTELPPIDYSEVEEYLKKSSNPLSSYVFAPSVHQACNRVYDAIITPTRYRLK